MRERESAHPVKGFVMRSMGKASPVTHKKCAQCDQWA